MKGEGFVNVGIVGCVVILRFLSWSIVYGVMEGDPL